MIHEVLLALSGHPSPLFGDKDVDGSVETDLPLLSPSEKALLRSLAKLSQLHRKLKRHLRSICESHLSIICRAVATSIEQKHLGRFQQRILDVESKILKKDASLVGAYEIVPLASVVGAFDDWQRKMAWYWEVAYFMSPAKETSRSVSRSTAECTSSQLIDKLRSETQTGFAEIEEAANELTKVAETAWLRQLSSWVIYGKIPSFGDQDFFIQSGFVDKADFRMDGGLLPGFVSSTTAKSILFIGKSLHQLQRHQQQSLSYSTVRARYDGSELARAHLKLLASLPLPIVHSQLSRIIHDIRLSLSQNVLQHLLPMRTTRDTLSCLRQFMLLSRGEFGEALIIEAENRLETRQQNMGRVLHQDPVKALQGLTIKDAELDQVMQQVWKTLFAEDNVEVDNVLECAQSHVLLRAANGDVPTDASASGPDIHVTSIAFNDLLFPSPAELTFFINPPVDLLLSNQDISIYSTISSYLIAIERGHFRLINLWRRSQARREYPFRATRDAEERLRSNKRAAEMRKVWATCSAATFLLAELAAFFEAEVVKGACNHFQEWVEEALEQDATEHSGFSDENSSQSQRDPETLATGHRHFLASLVYSLLLTDEAYTRELRSLLGNVDSLVAFFTRLFDVRYKLDLEQQTGEALPHIMQEEIRMSLALDRARKKVDTDMKSVINQLRALNQERVGSLRYADVRPGDQSDYQPWKGGGVDKLLVKLEFGRVSELGLDAA